MTADKVVDASVICAILFNEPRRPQAEAQLHNAGRLYAPALIDFEVASVALKNLRTYPAERAAMLRFYGNFQHFMLLRMNVDCVGAALLAEQENLSAYDASYLWLARHLGCELVTLDGKLAKAHGDAG